MVLRVEYEFVKCDCLDEERNGGFKLLDFFFCLDSGREYRCKLV